jgi:hypothetical protein
MVSFLLEIRGSYHLYRPSMNPSISFLIPGPNTIVDRVGTLQANSPAIWDSNWMQFRDDYDNRFPSVMAYIQKSIVDKHTKRLVKCREFKRQVEAKDNSEIRASLSQESRNFVQAL